jgi:hypothetical protein
LLNNVIPVAGEAAVEEEVDEGAEVTEVDTEEVIEV